MNCPNCGAPLTLVEGKDHFICNYCTSLYFPDQNTDGVRILEGEANLSCPVCNLPLVNAAIDENRVIACTKCNGILIPQWSFMYIVRYLREAFPEPLTPPRSLNTEELSRIIYCPSCHQMMDTHPYLGPGNVIIDNCVQCKVVWLDYGELHRILTVDGLDRHT
jgi:Zn-finger nucleic acid-binding protein